MLTGEFFITVNAFQKVFFPIGGAGGGISCSGNGFLSARLPVLYYLIPVLLIFCCLVKRSIIMRNHLAMLFITIIDI